jgi:hypothetical protein
MLSLLLHRAFKSLTQCKIVQHSPFPILKDETEVLELLVPSGRREREKKENLLFVDIKTASRGASRNAPQRHDWRISS